MENLQILESLMTSSLLRPDAKEKELMLEKLQVVSDWDAFFAKAVETHLAPLLHRTLSGVVDQVPGLKKIQKDLANSYNQVLARNIRLQHIFCEFTQTLNSLEMPIVPLKGIYLLETLYRDIGIRHLSDIDVLVKDEHLDEICDLMRQRGWKVKATLEHSTFEDNLFVHAHPFTLVKNDVSIELHTHLYHGSQGVTISKEALWADTHNEQFLGVEIRQFSNEIFLQHLCLHLHDHLFENELKVSSFCDIREFLRKTEQEFDWKRFKTISAKYECLEDLRQVLYLCKQYWYVSVPSELANPNLPLEEINKQFWNCMTGHSKNSGQILENKLNLRLKNVQKLDSWSDKFAFILGFVFPKEDFMRQTYFLEKNRWLFPWYVYRPIELTLKSIGAIINQIRATRD